MASAVMRSSTPLLRGDRLTQHRKTRPVLMRRGPAPVTARKDDAAAAVQAAIDNVAGSSSISGDGGGGLIHTTSG